MNLLLMRRSGPFDSCGGVRREREQDTTFCAGRMDVSHYSTYRNIVLPVGEIPSPPRHSFGQSAARTISAVLHTYTRLYSKHLNSSIVYYRDSCLIFVIFTSCLITKKFLAACETCAFSRYRALFGIRHRLVPCPRSVPHFLCYRVLFCLCHWAFI